MTKDAINKQIGARIRAQRRNHQLTLLELAKRVGLSEGNVQRYEAGNIANVSISVIQKFADALGIHPAVLMGWQREGSMIGESLTDREKSLVHKYRRLPEKRKDYIDEDIDMQLEKAERERAEAEENHAAS